MGTLYDPTPDSPATKIWQPSEGGTGGNTPETATIGLGGIPKNRLGIPGGIASKDESNRIPVDQIPKKYLKIADSVSVEGPSELLKNTTSAYKITNFDSFTTYQVSAIKGLVALNGDEVLYTAPNGSGDGGFIINDSEYKVRIFEPTIDKPRILTPISGSINRDIRVYLTSSPFTVEGGTGTHQSSTWQIATDQYFTNLFEQTVKDPENLTSWSNNINFKPSTVYYARVRYSDAIIGNSAWSETISFTTRSLFLPNSEEAKINPSNQAVSDGYGYTFEVSQDGNFLFASCELATVDNRIQAGRVHIFRRVSGVWVYITSISAANKSDGYKFGSSITINNNADQLVIGSSGYSANGLANSGAVYPFYKNSNGEWVQQVPLTPNNRHTEAKFSIAKMSGDGKTLVVAAYGQTDNGKTNAGVLYVFSKTADYWIQKQSISIANSLANDQYGEKGISVSYDGSVIAVSSFRKLVSSKLNAGSVSIYISTKTGYVLDGTIDNPYPQPDGNFGVSIDLSGVGNTIIIGAPGNFNSNNIGTGQAYYYGKSNGVWTLQHTFSPVNLLPGDKFGTSVSLSGMANAAVIGAPGRPYNAINESGSAFVFSKDSSEWVQANEIFSESSDAREGFANAVKISTDSKTVVVGSLGKNYTDSTEFGSLYIFT